MFLSPNLLLQSNSCSSLTGSSLPFIFIILISNIPLLRIFQGVFRGTFFFPRNYSHTADMISRHDMYMVFILLDYSLYWVVLRVSFLTDSFLFTPHIPFIFLRWCVLARIPASICRSYIWVMVLIITAHAVRPAGVWGWCLIAEWQTRPVIHRSSPNQSQGSSTAVSLVWLPHAGRRRNVHAPSQLPLILFVRD